MTAARSAGAPPHAQAFVERVASEPPPSVVVLAGAEAWFREDVLRALVARVLPEGDPGGAVVRLDARKPEERERTATALDEVRTPSLFGERKVVVVEAAEAAVLPGAPDARTDAIVHLASRVTSSPPTGSLLVLSTARPVKGKGAIDAEGARAAGAVVVDCRPLYDTPGPWGGGGAPWENELARWLSRRMQAVHRKTLDLPEAHAVAQRVGKELPDLDAALRTLALSLGATREEPIWRIVDAILERDAPRALDLVAAAFDRGLTDARGASVVRPDSIFAMLAAALHSSFRKALVAAEGLAAGKDPSAVARAAGVPPFLAEGFLRRARRDPEDLLRRHAAFLEAEAGVKGGGVPPRLAFERLVVALVAREAGRT